MPIFSYRARDNNGKLITHERAAQSIDSLSAQLIREDLTPISIELATNRSGLWANFKKRFLTTPVSTDELGIFTRQMYTLTKTGVPISEALKHLAESSSNKSMSDALNGMVEHLEGGQDIASSMQHFPDVFSPFIVSMVNVGQSGGRLAESFLQINQYLELESSAIKNAKTALRYPLFVVIAIAAAIIVINIFVIPSFATVFAASNVPLPWATRFLIQTSQFMVRYWLYLLVGTILLFVLFFRYIHSEKGKIRWHHLLLKLPIIGPILKRIVLLRFAQSFAVVITSGIPLIRGIELVGTSINNVYARERILSMRAAIERGNNLTQAATVTGLFTPLELQMLGVSEQTGELGEMLEQIASFYKREVDYDLRRINDFIEPALIIALSGVILLLAFAVYLPIWNMIKLTKGV